MKRGISILISIVMLFVIAGCGNAATQSGQESIASEAETQVEATIAVLVV